MRKNAPISETTSLDLWCKTSKASISFFKKKETPYERYNLFYYEEKYHVLEFYVEMNVRWILRVVLY